MIASLQRAYRLYRTDSDLDTIVAIAVTVAVLGPVLASLYRASNR